ncbi:x-pro dipeptidyl-peptidase domain-containing protein [Cyclospora cayetanensis]|uniref:X-pro dipeptidyl-peptidase domain-containing protein n=1 Tax=Cyclospora cayetanensis TaxID=88456 RepID=A0A1D3D824_9EIME|nr:x-pro dipeptidyl-peptidase domain-containing protein [Cyclospora cayetanensis]
MLLPPENSVWGWFFSYINGSIQQFVMRGVLGSLMFICLLHLVRVILHPIATSEQHRMLLEEMHKGRVDCISSEKESTFRCPLRSAGSVQWSINKRREGFCAHLIAGVCLALTVVQVTSFFFGGWTLKAIGFPDIYLAALTKPGGLWGHETATNVALEHLHLDTWGQYLQVKAIRHYLNKKVLLLMSSLFAVVMTFASFNLQGVPSCNSTDHHWVDFGLQRDLGHMTEADASHLASKPPLLYSQYVLMRDGVQLAADVHLPFSLAGSARAWALLQHRLHVLQTAAAAARAKAQAEEQDTEDYRRTTQQLLVSNGYAVVVVDTRGSGTDYIGLKLNSKHTAQIAKGYLEPIISSARSTHLPFRASFGFRSVDLGFEELQDSAQLVKWAKREWFSNGKVGGGGLSYDGMLGLSMAAGGGVDAVISLFTPMDVLGELVAPGGMMCHSFLNDYTGLTSDFERHGTPWRHMMKSPLHFPFHVLLGFAFSFGGISGVLGHEAELPNAIRAHHRNWKMTDAVSALRFYDDKVQFTEELEAKATSFGITKEIMRKLAYNNVSVLTVGGFCDSATARGAIRLFSYMQRKAPKSHPQLILGNWNHGGRRSCDPFGGNFSCFETNLYATVLRFFDCRLKNKCWGGIWEEAPVHYWQTGSGEWRAAETFPPGNTMQRLDLQFTNNPIKSHSTASKGAGRSSASLAPEFGAHLFDPHLHFSSGLEHVLHDIIQRVRLYGNMLRLYEEAAMQEETLQIGDVSTLEARHLQRQEKQEKQEQDTRRAGGLKAATPRSWLPRLLAALIAAVSSYGHTNPASELRELFSRDKNAYFLQLPKKAKDSTPSALAVEKKREQSVAIEYTVEYLFSSGEYSRWIIGQHPFRMPVHYGNRLFPMKRRPEFPLTISPDQGHPQHFSLSPYSLDQLLARPLSFVTDPLLEPIEMVGSAFLSLTIYAENCNDLTLFAYLEDVDVAVGYSHYITEGQLMASNRPSEASANLPVGAYGRVSRSFSRQDHKPLDEGGESVAVSLNFEPHSWTFNAGHAIRLVLTGSDNDNFSFGVNTDVRLPSTWKVVTSSAILSLPVLETK